MARDIDGIHEDEATWGFNVFMKKSVAAVINTRLASRHNVKTSMASAGKTVTIKTYPPVRKRILRLSTACSVPTLRRKVPPTAEIENDVQPTTQQNVFTTRRRADT